VQNAVRRQQQEFLQGRVPSGLCLALGDLGAQHDVTKQPGRCRCVLRARAEFIHGEAQHIGRAWLIHPLHVQLFHSGFVDENDVEVGLA
jgi:hypothetical protein